MAETKQVLIGENLFDMSEGKPSLIVTHCKSCGDYFFPKTFTCHNPECAGKDVEDTHLSRRGKVENYSVMNYPPPPPFVTKDPYEPIVCAAVAQWNSVAALAWCCAAGFEIEQLSTRYIPGPKVMTFLYEGSARPCQ